jgi:hypothetical protein
MSSMRPMRPMRSMRGGFIFCNRGLAEGNGLYPQDCVGLVVHFPLEDIAKINTP